jgi:3-oxoacyl-[acyl-carrier-protein] synthase-3
MKVNFKNIQLSAISSAYPKGILDLNVLSEKFAEKEIKRIIASTGIESVHIANGETNASDLCVDAAKNLFVQLDIDPKTIDAIIFITQTPDRVAPATSSMMQHRLGLPTSAVAFDINYGCSGYIYGLFQAALLLNSESFQKVLVCTGDVISPLLHKDSHQLRMLLGDAGTATLVERGEDVWCMEINTDGSGAQHLTAAKILPNRVMPQEKNDKGNGYYHMDGNEVMSFAMRVVPEIIDNLLIKKQWSKSDVGTFALHQPNEFMLRYLRKKLGVDEQTVPICVRTVGNTGPASIPLLLSMKGNELKYKRQLEKTILSGFGVGLSWGGIALNLSKTHFFEPIEV